ncbi:hypothetical protein [Tateyamaria pelophila]|uniref:hypothetical protein n=1 Tax=Tateyamaria pelophila TaxID=328415 RepID=UPI001CBDE9A1|nr:hypothetical protein [Tateyamaria pelophila]
MKPPSKPAIFLERSGYRQRRMMDALRVLPVLGVFLWMFPLFWPTGPAEHGIAEPVKMSSAVIYVFGVWVLLIAMSFGLRRILRATLEQEAAEVEEASGGEAR